MHSKKNMQPASESSIAIRRESSGLRCFASVSFTTALFCEIWNTGRRKTTIAVQTAAQVCSPSLGDSESTVARSKVGARYIPAIV